MLKRIIAIAVILAATSVGWFILGATISSRTYESNDRLKPGVASIWGAPQEQLPPSATVEVQDPQHTEMLPKQISLPIESSRIQVDLALDYRQKGLLWYSTYSVNFAATYAFRNSTAQPQTVTFQLLFSAEKAIYDGVVMEVNGQSQPLLQTSTAHSLPRRLHPKPPLRCAWRISHRAWKAGATSWARRSHSRVISN